MIRGLHGLFYSTDPDGVRAFLRDKLKLPYTDVGEGWLVFDLPAGDLGVHPTDGNPPSNTHDVSFFCDDIAGTVKDLRSRGVACDEPGDRGYGWVTYFTMPGDVRVQLYEPKYTKKGAVAKAATTAKLPAVKQPAKKRAKAKRAKAKAKKR
jgi:hypothetical protein